MEAEPHPTRNPSARRGLDRRALLSAAVGGGALALPGLARPRPARADRATRRVVVVAFAGGVRSRDTLGAEGSVPFLEEMASEGVLYTRVRTANLGHFGASLSILTGVAEPRGIRENARGPSPTLFEYVRKDLGLPPGEAWIATSGGTQQTNFSHGVHPDYGARYGANTLDGDGLFNAEFRDMIASYGRPRSVEGRERELLAQMRASLGGGEGAGAAEAAAQLEEYVLGELARGTADIRGANAADAKALRVARNLVAIFRPTLTGVVLQQADVAHGSFNAYLEVVRRNDAALGELWNAVRADPELAATTAFVVVPEFGRDADLNARRGLDHGDGSDDLNYVSAVCWGPDFRSGTIVREEVGVVDVCPTVCDLLGAQARHTRGRRLPRLYA